MSSYYPSFNYRGLNSFKDKKLLVVHFESGDDGEMDTFLGMDPIYTDNVYGTKRHDYGAKYNSVAVIRISVIKADGTDFTVKEVRDFLKWTTGARKVTYLDLVDQIDGASQIAASVLGRITAVYQQKLDARTVGMVIEHTSISPWAYSEPQVVSCSFGQALTVDENGVLYKDGQSLSVDKNGTLENGTNAMFDVTDDGVVYIDNSTQLRIDNLSDDLDSYVVLDTTFTNTNSDHLIIKNQTLYEDSDSIDGLTEITDMVANEVVRLTSDQFIISDVPGKIFGNSFNFIWPKLVPGVNDIVVSGTGKGIVDFTYRYPIKIGDCSIDIYVSGGDLCCGGSYNGPDTASGPVAWGDIINKPSTIQGYGITNAYTIAEIDNKLSNAGISIDETALNNMLQKTLG